MRYFEIAGGFRIEISEEEQEILDAAETEVLAEDLDERGLELASKMISRGLLIMQTTDDKISFIQNKLQTLWRF